MRCSYRLFFFMFKRICVCVPFSSKQHFSDFQLIVLVLGPMALNHSNQRLQLQQAPVSIEKSLINRQHSTHAVSFGNWWTVKVSDQHDETVNRSHSFPSGGGGNLNRARGSVKVLVKGKLFHISFIG